MSTFTHNDPGAAAAQTAAEGEIKKAILGSKANSCPMAVRLAWHASGTFDKADGSGGSDGATMRYAPESTDGANAGLGIERDILKPVHRACPRVSEADSWALAGGAAVNLCGGPRIAVRLGRTDAADASKCPANGRLPDASQGAQHLRDVFYRMGFDDRAIVSLSGAHTLGRCHKSRSGFDGPWTTQPLRFDNEYFKNLLEKTWVKRDWDGNFQYADKETGLLMMLPTDLALIEDPKFRVHVEAYAADEKLFFADFKKDFETLVSNGCPHACKMVEGADAALDAAAANDMRENCMHGSLEHAKVALASRANADAKAVDLPSMRSALHKASFWGHDHIIGWLLDDLKLDVNAVDAEGDAGLHDAARFGHVSVVKALVARGASKDLKNNKGMTAREVAAENGKDECAALL